MIKNGLAPLSYVASEAGLRELGAIVVSALLLSILNAEPLFGTSHLMTVASGLLSISVAYAAAVIFARQRTYQKFEFNQLLVPSLLFGFASGIAFMTFVSSRDQIDFSFFIAAVVFFTFGLWLFFLMLLGFIPWVLRLNSKPT